MTSRRLLTLPIEIKHCILLHLARPVYPPPRPVRPHRCQSTVSLSRPVPLHAVESTASTPSGSVLPIFESPDATEYTQVPPSTLDAVAPSPRSPAESLLSLLSQQNHTAALHLLRELEQSHQSIPKDYAFGEHALHLLRDHGWTSDWIEWWQLTPAVTDLVTLRLSHLRRHDSRQARQAAEIAMILVDALELHAHDRRERAKIVNQMRQFGTQLVQQGHARPIAETLVKEIAIEAGEPALALELWQDTLRELSIQTLSPQASQIEHEWFAVRTAEAFRVLVRSRERIIRALANLGRLDDAVSILTSTHQFPSLLSPSQPIRLSSRLYLRTLALLSAQNRFDLFELVYRHAELDGKRLVRIEREHLKTHGPYYVRGVRSPAARGIAPSAQEAFNTFRYQHVVSSIEEGSFQLDSIRSAPRRGETDMDEFAAVSGEDYEHYGTPTSREESDRLKALVDEGRLDAAFDKVVLLLKSGPLPSAQSVANFIHAITDHVNGQEAIKMIDKHVEVSHSQRGFWNSCKMLTDLQNGQHHLVVRRFKEYFTLSGLPPSFVKRIQAATKGTPSIRPEQPQLVDARGRRARLKRTTPNAYVVAILTQALTPLLSSLPVHNATTLEHWNYVAEIYSSLLNPHAFRVIPSHRHNDASDPNQSPLDPHTFIPFLIDRLQPNPLSLQDPGRNEESQPDRLLDVMRSMHRLRLLPQLPHFALLLSSYARTSATFDDFDYLYAFCTASVRPGSTWLEPVAPRPGVSPALISVVETHQNLVQKTLSTTATSSPEPSSLGQSPRFFATILKSLRLRRDSIGGDKAFELIEGLVDKLGKDRLRAMLTDVENGGDRFKFEIGKLGAR
ncbi:uncharacterized protein JCM15063_006569 [Sporobolomyces koalae]|uniref:uncharacterized protein n=1 Tax=Sporobolomyces koalae TaxID=500713 RepID=UPI00317A14B1